MTMYDRSYNNAIFISSVPTELSARRMDRRPNYPWDNGPRGGGRGYSTMPNASMGMHPPPPSNGRGYNYPTAAVGASNSLMMSPPPVAPGASNASMMPPPSARWMPPSRNAGSIVSTTARQHSTVSSAGNRQPSTSSQRNENKHPNHQAASTNPFVIDRKRESIDVNNSVKRVKTEPIDEQPSNAYDADTATDSDTHVIFAIDFSGMALICFESLYANCY